MCRFALFTNVALCRRTSLCRSIKETFTAAQNCFTTESKPFFWGWGGLRRYKPEILRPGSRSGDGVHKTQGISWLTEFWFPRNNLINCYWRTYVGAGREVAFTSTIFGFLVLFII
jgi:hypothetical protein